MNFTSFQQQYKSFFFDQYKAFYSHYFMLQIILQFVRSRYVFKKYRDYLSIFQSLWMRKFVAGQEIRNHSRDSEKCRSTLFLSVARHQCDQKDPTLVKPIGTQKFHIFTRLSMADFIPNTYSSRHCWQDTNLHIYHIIFIYGFYLLVFGEKFQNYFRDFVLELDILWIQPIFNHGIQLFQNLFIIHWSNVVIMENLEIKTEETHSYSLNQLQSTFRDNHQSKNITCCRSTVNHERPDLIPDRLKPKVPHNNKTASSRLQPNI